MCRSRLTAQRPEPRRELQASAEGFTQHIAAQFSEPWCSATFRASIQRGSGSIPPRIYLSTCGQQLLLTTFQFRDILQLPLACGVHLPPKRGDGERSGAARARRRGEGGTLRPSTRQASLWSHRDDISADRPRLY